MRHVPVLVLSVMVLLVAGCGEEAQGPTPEQIAQEKVQQAMAAGESGENPGLEVKVAPDGTVFQPPVRVEQLPGGVWYCDLGTVHYARQEEGAGRCAKCGMELTYNPE